MSKEIVTNNAGLKLKAYFENASFSLALYKDIRHKKYYVRCCGQQWTYKKYGKALQAALDRAIKPEDVMRLLAMKQALQGRKEKHKQ